MVLFLMPTIWLTISKLKPLKLKEGPTHSDLSNKIYMVKLLHHSHQRRSEIAPSGFPMDIFLTPFWILPLWPLDRPLGMYHSAVEWTIEQRASRGHFTSRARVIERRMITTCFGP